VKPFTYLTPTDTAEAVALLDRHAPTARVIAGGQSLLLAMKDRSQRPGVLVSVAGLADLNGVSLADNGELVVGATTTYAQLMSVELSGWHREIGAVAGNLADRPVRTMGTLGGALCAAEPRFDMPALVLGVDATIDIVSATGARPVAAEDFFLVGGGTSLAPNELLSVVRFPAPDRWSAVAFEKFRQRTFDAALTSALCAVRIEDAELAEVRITIGATTPVPRVCHNSATPLVGAAPADVDADAVAHAVADEVLPEAADDLTRYRHELIVSLTRRALMRALTTYGS
jgi:aerobic carbon-monoxide dehydrogenase medium subunit